MDILHIIKKNIILKCFVIFMVVPIIYIFARLCHINENNNGVMILTMASITMVLGVVYYRNKTFGLNIQDLIWGIIVIGIIIRIAYMLKTSCYVRSHDLGNIDLNSFGHAAYILTIIDTWKLPKSNMIQFYQQPFYYYIGAVFSTLINKILNCTETYYLVDAAKTVSCSFSCASLLICKELCSFCGVKERGQLVSLALIVFLPASYLAAGRVGIDSAVCFFMAAALLYTAKWVKDKSLKHTIALALIYGFGMMTKISMGVIAIVTAAVFLWTFIITIKKQLTLKENNIKKPEIKKKYKRNEAVQLLIKYFVFAVISLPLGLWYSVRNYILFNQPLTYVLKVNTDSVLYTGDHGVLQRLFGIDFYDLFICPYVDLRNNYCAPVYMLKSSLFGEFRYNIKIFIPITLLFFVIIIFAYYFFSLWYNVKKSEKNINDIILISTLVLYYASYLFFYYKYPFTCSMDFRYLLFLIFPSSVLLGKCYDDLLIKHRRIRWVLQSSLIIFSIFSCAFCIFMK